MRPSQAKLTPRPLAPKMSLYDLSDPPQIFEDEPDRGVGRSIAWAINAAHTLAASSETAEQMTVSAEKLFAAFLASAVVEPALVVQVAALRSTIFLQNVVVSVLGAVLMTVMSATLVWRLA